MDCLEDNSVLQCKSAAVSTSVLESKHERRKPSWSSVDFSLLLMDDMNKPHHVATGS